MATNGGYTVSLWIWRFGLLTEQKYPTVLMAVKAAWSIVEEGRAAGWPYAIYVGGHKHLNLSAATQWRGPMWEYVGSKEAPPDTHEALRWWASNKEA